MLLKIYLFAYLFCFTANPITDHNTKKITVTGTAVAVKGGSLVETGKDGYFLDGVDHWDAEFIGKKVKVTGRLVIVTYKQASTYPGEFQEWVGTGKI